MHDEEGARFSPQSTKNKNGCCVNGCGSKACKDFTVRFHSFPKPGIDFVNIVNKCGVVEVVCRRDAWKQKLMMNKRITENMRVCSLHFKRSDYILPDAPTQKRYLKRDAVPSCNLPTPIDTLPSLMAENKLTETAKFTEKSPDKESLSYGLVLIKSETLEPEIKLETPHTYIIEQDHSYTMQRPSNESTQFHGLTVKEEPKIKDEPLDMDVNQMYEYETSELRLTNETEEMNRMVIKDESEDSKESEIKFESVDLPDIDIDLNNHFQQIWEPVPAFVDGTTQETITRIDNSTQTDETIESKFIDILKTDKDLNIMTGIPNFAVLKKIIHVVKVISPRLAKAPGLKINVTDRVIMTFMKLKQGLGYGALAIFFKCSSKTSCKRIVLKTLDVLSEGLKYAICWPSRNELIRRIPDDFQKFGKIRCLVNRIEIAVRKSKNLSRRITSRSHYKRYHSLKFVTAITPRGSICFLSKACEGRFSHRQAFEQSNLIGSLKKNDSVMILKDFPIDDLCRNNKIKLVRSLFAQNRESTSNPNGYRSLLNVNRKIRRFRIFNRKLTASMSVRAHKIITILCAVENLQKTMNDAGITNAS